MEQGKIYRTKGGVIFKFIKDNEDGVVSGKILYSGKGNYKVGDVVDNLIASKVEKEIVDREEKLKYGEGVRIPYVTTMYIDFNNAKLKSGTISHILDNDRDIIKRYSELDFYNMNAEELSRVTTTAHRFLQLATHDVLVYSHANGITFKELEGKRTVNVIAKLIEENGISTTNISTCKSEINKPVVQGVIFLNLFKDEYSKDEVTAEFIKSNINFTSDNGFDSFNEIFYIVNGYRL